MLNNEFVIDVELMYKNHFNVSTTYLIAALAVFASFAIRMMPRLLFGKTDKKKVLIKLQTRTD